MRVVLTKLTVTAVVDAMREATDLEEGGHVQLLNDEWRHLSPIAQEEYVDHLMGIAQYASSLARLLNQRRQANG